MDDETIIEIPDSDTCLICLEDIDLNKYAIVDESSEEMFKYHIECLQEWFRTNPCRGVLKNIQVESYSIFVNGDKIISIPLQTQRTVYRYHDSPIYIENRNIDCKRCCYIVLLIILIITTIFFIRTYIY
jgi:hypothetical protein